VQTVILNADDFGASSTTNAAILLAHREGVLTSASLMVNEGGAPEAVDLARANRGLGVGLHLVLSNGLPALPPAEIPALVDAYGRFRNDPAIAGLRGFFLPSARRQIRREVAAQFERFAETGLEWSHVDGHQHLHLHPIVWDAVLEQTRRFPVRWIRIPYEEFLPATRERIAGRRVEWLFFRALRKRCLRSLKRAGMASAERVYGHLETGRMTEEYVMQLLARLKGRLSEIYFHPGTPHAMPLRATDGDGTDVELHALLSERVRERIGELGLRLADYRSAAPEEVAGFG
jgi:chitin disaccharide deacetylase